MKGAVKFNKRNILDFRFIAPDISNSYFSTSDSSGVLSFYRRLSEQLFRLFYSQMNELRLMLFNPYNQCEILAMPTTCNQVNAYSILESTDYCVAGDFGYPARLD